MSAQHQTWLVHRTYEDFQGLDRQIHRFVCVFVCVCVCLCVCVCVCDFVVI